MATRCDACRRTLPTTTTTSTPSSLHLFAVAVDGGLFGCFHCFAFLGSFGTSERKEKIPYEMMDLMEKKDTSDRFRISNRLTKNGTKLLLPFWTFGLTENGQERAIEWIFLTKMKFSFENKIFCSWFRLSITLTQVSFIRTYVLVRKVLTSYCRTTCTASSRM